MTNSDPRIGTQVGNYRIVEIINSGTFGSVYKGKHLHFEHDPIVAIKLPRATFHTEEECNAFIQEAQLQRQLRHPHILPIFDAGFQNSMPYLVTMYAAGGSLRAHLGKRNGQPLPLDEALIILTQVGQALHYAHQYQPSVVHRDLKPENILFDEQGNVLLADFGIAVLLSSIRTGLVGPGGTPPYMAPEQFEGLASPKSDQYALGCLAYELLTGRKVFSIPNPSLEAWWYHHARVEPVPPRQYNPHLPAPIEQAILTAISKDRANRYRDIFAFIQAMTGTKEQWRVEGSVPDSPEAWVEAAIAHMQGARFAEALAAYEQAIRLNPQLALAYKGQGDALHALHNSQEAIAAYEQAIRLDSNDATMYRGKGNALYDLERYQEALTAYEQACPIGTVLCFYNVLCPHLVAWSPDGTRIVSHHHSTRTQPTITNVWDVETQKPLLTYEGHRGFYDSASLDAIAWSAEGKWIASAAGNVQIWNAITGDMFCTYGGHEGAVVALAWSPKSKGSLIASASRDKTVRVWDIGTKVTLITYRGHSEKVCAVAWSPDGKQIVSGSQDQTVQVWDAETGKPIRIFEGLPGSIEAIAWSRNGEQIAVSYHVMENMVQIWNVATGGCDVVYRGHKDSVLAMTWSHDGKFIASASNNAVHIWDASTGEHRFTFDRFYGFSKALAWSYDSTRVASAVFEGVVVWQAT